MADFAAAPTLTRENTLPSCLPGRCSLATLSRRPQRRRAPGLCRRSAHHARELGRSGLVRSCPTRSSRLPPTCTSTRFGASESQKSESLKDRTGRSAQTAAATARIRGRGQLTLPAEVREALHVAEGDEVEFTRHDDGTVTVHGLKTIPAGQAWSWSPQRQAGERGAGRATAAGDLSPVYASAQDIFADLDRRAWKCRPCRSRRA